jgi:ribosomal protein L7/L12
MEVNIGENFGSFSLAVMNATKEELLKLRIVTDELQGISTVPETSVYVPTQYADVSSWSYDKQQSFLVAARLFYCDNGNKITTIKHIRGLSESPTLSLLNAKQIVDFAMGETFIAPDWMKTS